MLFKRNRFDLRFFFPRPTCKANGPRQGSTILHGDGGTTKSWRGYVDKTEARLMPGIVQLYSAVVYSSKDDYLSLTYRPSTIAFDQLANEHSGT